VKPRQLYNLIANFKAAQTCDSLSFRHGNHSLIDGQVSEILERVIAEMDENAREQEVLANLKGPARLRTYRPLPSQPSKPG
jgi:hypothetical protein